MMNAKCGSLSHMHAPIGTPGLYWNGALCVKAKVVKYTRTESWCGKSTEKQEVCKRCKPSVATHAPRAYKTLKQVFSVCDGIVESNSSDQAFQYDEHSFDDTEAHVANPNVDWLGNASLFLLVKNKGTLAPKDKRAAEEGWVLQVCCSLEIL